MLDPGLSYLRANADKMFICSAYPTTYTEASSTFLLSTVTLLIGNWAGPASNAESGRVLSLDPFYGVPVTASGVRAYVAFCNATQTKIIHVTECTNEYMASGDTILIPATEITFAQPV